MSDMHKLTGAYALNAVDDLERARFEQHLAECDDCRAEVAELRETAALLSETIAVEAPASLRVSVLAGISQVRPLPPEIPVASLMDRQSEKRAGRRNWVPFLVAAALAVLVGIGASVIQPWKTDEVSQLTAAEQVIGAPDAQEVSLDLGEAGRAIVIRSKAEDRAVIRTEDMVSAPEGKVYELWLLAPDGKYTSAGLMPDEPDQTLVLDGSASSAAGVGITIEPDGGSDKPSAKPIALFDLTQAT